MGVVTGTKSRGLGRSPACTARLRNLRFLRKRSDRPFRCKAPSSTTGSALHPFTVVAHQPYSLPHFCSRLTSGARHGNLGENHAAVQLRMIVIAKRALAVPTPSQITVRMASTEKRSACGAGAGNAV